jgi:putative hydrolase
MNEEPTFMRFRSLITSPANYDYHIHTLWTDGQATVEEYIRVALQKGLKGIAFTEHVRKTSTWFDAFVDEVKNHREKEPGIDILYGIEAKVLDYNGNLDATKEMIQKSEIVLGSVHRYPNRGSGYLNFQELSFDKAAEIEFNLACALLRNPHIDVLAHPGGVFEKNFDGVFPEEYLEKIIEVANQQEKAIEINSSYLEDWPRFLRLCSKLNPLISLGSDAHSVAELGSVLRLIRGHND